MWLKFERFEYFFKGLFDGIEIFKGNYNYCKVFV